MRLFKRKPPYDLDEIDAQIGSINELITQRDILKLEPLVVSHQQIDNQNDAIEVAQEILKYMLEEVQVYNREHAFRASSQRHREVVSVNPDYILHMADSLAKKK